MEKIKILVVDDESVFKMLENELKNNFTIGIVDDVTNTSLPKEDYYIDLDDEEILIYGYGSDDGASTHLCLFVAYYNFLRPHSYTHFKPLNEVPELEKVELMPAKWQVLIQLSQQLILQQQKT